MIPQSLDPATPPRQRRAAFTLVELIIVITVIILILAIAIPALSAMGAEARLTAAQQTIQGTTTQAYSLALANRAMTAVRFFPGDWDTIDPAQARVPGGRQHLAIYSYVGTSAQDNGGTWSITFGEYFERAKDLSSVAMPEDVWAAPLEALATGSYTLSGMCGGSAYTISYGSFGSNFVLGGTTNSFSFDAAERNCGGPTTFLNGDDFLVVCDPESGVRTGTPVPFHLRAYVPPIAGSPGYEADNNGSGVLYQRYSFSGVVTYPREPFMSLPGGPNAAGVDRQNYLRESGRPFMVHRYSGGLLPGLQPPATP